MCGTVCCAIGWTPKIFPKIVKWYRNTPGDPLNVKIKNTSKHGYQSVAAHLFGLEYNLAVNLFSPDDHPDEEYGLHNLNENATPKQVASALKKFLKKAKNEGVYCDE